MARLAVLSDRLHSICDSGYQPAWLVFAQTAILQFLVAAFISLVVHLAVKIANNPTLGIVFVCALMG